MNKLLLAVLSLCISVGAAAQDSLYTWEDEKGTRHYSTKAPTDYEYEIVGSANEITLDPDLVRAREEAQAEAATAEPVERKDDGLTDEERAQACTQISEQLGIYEQRLTSGEREMADEERQAELAAMQQVRERLQGYCD